MTVELLSPMAAVPLEDHHDMMARFALISLDELNNAAALQTRTDRKYLLTWDQFQTLLPQLNHCRVLEIDGRRWFRYRSMYFDTLSLASYLGAAHGSPRRFKVRTRTYVDSGECYIEAKLRNRRGQTVKSRQVHRGPDETIDDTDRTFLNGFERLRPFVDHQLRAGNVAGARRQQGHDRHQPVVRIRVRGSARQQSCDHRIQERLWRRVDRPVALEHGYSARADVEICVWSGRDPPGVAIQQVAPRDRPTHFSVIRPDSTIGQRGTGRAEGRIDLAAPRQSGGEWTDGR